ncbi:ABC transporter ATP-binding protein [Ruicaihuangia caeni]|uniref:ABC transporter ATP-binding protein n=1 Tax=Ruicaihuangia caeni TaxID=3042517 RepID=UPI00338E3CB4
MADRLSAGQQRDVDPDAGSASRGRAIEVHGLTKHYGPHEAVRGIRFSVERGTVYGLIGPNGAGKTTTLRMLVDIIRPSSGTMRVLGVDPRRGGPALRRRIGYLPGDLRLSTRMRGRALLDHFARISGPVAPGAIDALAERFDLDLDRPVRALSKGNRQKLGIVQAFMHEPELIVLDEPTGGLDPLMQREFIDLVREARDRGQTLLLSSHVLSEIQQAADRVAVLSAGRIVAEGDVESLRLASIRRLRATIAGTTADAVGATLGSISELRDLTLTPGGEARDPVRVAATIDGPVDPVIKALARHLVVDLTVEEPDLEESVLSLYGDEGRQGQETSLGTGSRFIRRQRHDGDGHARPRRSGDTEGDPQ